MMYISTRGRAAPAGFCDVLLSGLAPDGGLYLPAEWPRLSGEEIARISRLEFCDAAAEILACFSGKEISASLLREMAIAAYAPFDAPEITPLRRLGGDDYLLELFHGPTLAFKDVAMRLLAQLYDWALEGAAKGKTIIGATSGDTGGAAIAAFAGSEKSEVFMLHPKGKISHVQRRMMTTIDADNIVNIAVEGTFDDCQRIVKNLFADASLNAKVDLGGVNSINWVRLAIQTVYYFTASGALDSPASFVVPTGNFGDVFAGYVAKRMGLPVNMLCVAVNENDIMRRVIRSGVYRPASARQTSSPSMDIQVASNFERLLFDACERDAHALCALMSAFEKDGEMTLGAAAAEKIAEEFAAERADESEVAGKIRALYEASGMLVDPHTAVGLVALDKLRAARAVSGKAIALATAHPAKFPEAVEKACGVTPALPERFKDLHARAETLIEAPADAASVRDIVLSRSRFV